MEKTTYSEIALSTSDNPYNPITDYDSWDAYDRMKGYGTAEYLARVSIATSEFGDGSYAEDLERTIDEAVLLNLISWTHEGISYIKVVGNPIKSNDSAEDSNAD